MRSRHELRKTAAVKSGFPAREGCTLPQFMAFFTVAISGLFALGMLGDFLCLTTDVSEALPYSGWNIRVATTRCAVLCWVDTVVLRLRQLLYTAFSGLDTYGVCLRIVYLFCFLSFSIFPLCDISNTREMDIDPAGV